MNSTTPTSFLPVRSALSEAERHATQQAFADSGAELTVGDVSACPLPLDELKRLSCDDPRVVTYFGGGLTGEVFCLDVDGRRYNIKRKLPVARVANVESGSGCLVSSTVGRLPSAVGARWRTSISSKGIVVTCLTFKTISTARVVRQ